MSLILIYLGTGAGAGFLAGLLGIGGGTVLVPALLFLFAHQGISGVPLILLAVGTTFANIVFTAIASTLAHHRRANVAWAAVGIMLPGTLAGTLAGAVFAAQAPVRLLEATFLLFLFYMGGKLCWPKAPVAQPASLSPSPARMRWTAGAIGAFSSLIGIGGAALMVPFLVRCKVDFKRAVGTSAALGLPLALSGTAGYMLTGWGHPNLPAWSLGYVYLPALAGLTAAGMLAAPLGARLAHHLPVARLQQIFGLVLILIGMKMALPLATTLLPSAAP